MSAKSTSAAVCRLAGYGCRIDSTKLLTFSFDGKQYTGCTGDTLASALLANGVRIVGRSYKYHRPRGIMTCGVEEPNALVGTGVGARFEPNRRATMVEMYEGLQAVSQNKFPSLKHDFGQILSVIPRLFPAGFYYKTFMHPRVLWKHVYEPVIRKIAGLGKPPKDPDPDVYSHFYYHTDVMVVGGGIAGLLAARSAAQSGASVMLVEQLPYLGGRVFCDNPQIDAQEGRVWIEKLVSELRSMPNVTIRTRMVCVANYDHNYCLLHEDLADWEEIPSSKLRHRLWRVRCKKVLLCSGAIERPLAFACNDRPGVMLASAVRDYLQLYGVKAGKRVLVYTNNDDGYHTASQLTDAGVFISAVLDVRSAPGNSAVVKVVQAKGITTLYGKGIAKVYGQKCVEKISVCDIRESGRTGSLREINCDVVAMSGGWTPSVHLWCHAGGKLKWDEDNILYKPDSSRPPINGDGSPAMSVIGSANGALLTADVIHEAISIGHECAKDFGCKSKPLNLPKVENNEDFKIKPMWFTPSYGSYVDGTKHFIDFQHDVAASDIELAIREGYTSVEHTKRYTTLGMATDQGKLSNINGLGLMADALRADIPDIGTTTFRPPYIPYSVGSIGGTEKGVLFKVVRKTPLHKWHVSHNAVWEPVGDWRRPYTYCKAGMSRHDSVNAEIKAIRSGVGILDASTLGKILVQGPDAAKFMDLVYTNMMSTLKLGRCRYGLMCNDNGFLFDDGVIVRLSEDVFLCHTTSGGADRVHAWFEHWLQTEWIELRVFVVNVTEQWSQIAVVGPKAREMILKVGTDIDMSPESFTFMGFKEGKIGGAPVRVFRISFSGELSYEIATPSLYGLPLWRALFDVGSKDYDITAYGTEALHVMRAEKGYIMIGDETDGTVIPHDVGLSGLVSRKKEDFIGKRALQRSHLIHGNRRVLVGLETEDPKVIIPHGSYAVENILQKPPMKTIGYVTSSYWSPTLGRSIAMALIEAKKTLGEKVAFPQADGRVIKARIVSPVFYDKDGERQNV